MPRPPVKLGQPDPDGAAAVCGARSIVATKVSKNALASDRGEYGEYGNTSEYLRELIRRDRQHVAQRRLRDLIADGLESGDGRPATADVIDDIRRRAFAADT